MSRETSSGNPRFATTRWSVVLAASGPDAEEALATLCKLYWYPVYAFFRRSRRSAEDAGDLTQQLFSDMIARKDFAAADPVRGRFRSWLLACAKHCQNNAHDAATALKRGGGAEIVSIDAMDAESRYKWEPVDAMTPERLYERRWAMTIMGLAVAALRRENATAEKLPFFDAVKGLLSLEHAEDADYAAVCKELALDVRAARTRVSRLRDRLAVLLRAEIEQTVQRPEDAEEEWRHLFAALKPE